MTEANWIGQTIGGRYVIESLLGQGGMSAVYRATDPNLRRPVAVKLVHAHLTHDQDFVRRFEAEAATVAQLRHPNIIQVFDFDHDGSTFFMVLEFVPGETLHARLRRLNAEHQKLPVGELLSVAINVAEAIDYAHARGLVHRDIKPANVMINPQGQAVLMDFGIAKIMGSANQTATGTVIGTAQYIAPEQVRGQRPTPKSDIYALGVTLFEMAAGQVPFDGDSAMSIMLKHVNDPVPDLRRLNPQTPSDVVAIIERCLSKEPDKRFASGADLAEALREVQARLKAGRPARPAALPAEARPSPMATIMEPAPREHPAPSAAPPPPAPPPAPAPAYAPGEPPPPVFNRPAAAPQARPALPAAVPPPQPRARRGPNLAVLIGGAVVVLACVGLVGGGVFLANHLGLFSAPQPTPVAATATAAPPPATATSAVVAPTSVPPTEAPAPTEAPVLVVPAGMVLIPGGAFNMGSVTGAADEQPLHPVALSPYFIDQFEVTNERYLACVSETICTSPAGAGSFTRPSYFGDPAFAQYPVVLVSWAQAEKFCAWDGGKRLPTEAEWEYAATGGDNRPYPWGVDFNSTILPANEGDTQPVGSYPEGASPFGLFDMAGNVLEWVADNYDSQFYAESVTDNPHGPEFGDGRVLRGGSFGAADGSVYTTTRRYHQPEDHADVDIGFRCAQSAP
ncbi:MAG: SUMF1/EgtB/PvdO family nonheme iron enzyme [Anaerolineales bacterium]|nr:SUMF1/EgtB/PvdO family nonheme iron enzyme [Anaerolineales bacterium]